MPEPGQKRKYNPNSRANLRQFKPPPAPDSVSLPPDSHADVTPITEPNARTMPTVQNQQLEQTVILRPLVPDAAKTVQKAMNSPRASWQTRLNAATFVLESCGIGPQQSGNRLAAAATDPGTMAPVELAAFLDAGARALALRRASAGAVDAVIVSERPAPGTMDPKPE